MCLLTFYLKVLLFLLLADLLDTVFIQEAFGVLIREPLCQCQSHTTPINEMWTHVNIITFITFC